jgi:hypothetical protein
MRQLTTAVAALIAISLAVGAFAAPVAAASRV